MREILFRGKRTDNGEWVYGNYLLLLSESCNYIVMVGGYIKCVIPGTVGQFTGLRDRNGTRIFEGDIVEHNTFHNDKIRTGIVRYDEKYGAFFIGGSGYSDNQMYTFCNFKVVGNIYDNPKLLEGELK